MPHSFQNQGNSKMTDLKPCPFCGGESVIRVHMGMAYICPIHKRSCVIKPNTWLQANLPIKVQIKGWNMRAKSVKYQTAADVVEVRHGEWLTWEEQFPDRKPTKKNNLGMFCNNCHSHADNMTDYCPNCGAKMDGKRVRK